MGAPPPKGTLPCFKSSPPYVLLTRKYKYKNVLHIYHLSIFPPKVSDGDGRDVARGDTNRSDPANSVAFRRHHQEGKCDLNNVHSSHQGAEEVEGQPFT